jgi:uncharacterized membrane protein YtjA (UPF0391 family)
MHLRCARTNHKPNGVLAVQRKRPGIKEKENVMPGGLIGLAIIFFIIALVAYVLGARGVAGMSAGIGRTLLFVFLVLAIIFVVIGLLNGHAAV